MSDYTPTTDEVRNNMAWGVIVAMHMPKLAGEVEWPAPGVRDVAKAQFDAWLASERARIWDEGYDAGERDVLAHVTFDEPCIPNPYRDEVDS
jgi:hypothetical protein